MKNTNATFINNTHDQLLYMCIAATLLHNHDFIFPYGFFQYMVLTNDTTNLIFSNYLDFILLSLIRMSYINSYQPLMQLIK